jgi:putative DNA primase/helicase
VTSAEEAILIAELAALSPLDYERRRKSAAKQLGISRMAVLDAAVEAVRRASGGRNDPGQGERLVLSDIDPWPDPVDGSELMTGLVNAVRNHIVVDDEDRVATSLWAIAAHAFRSFPIFPRLFVTSPEMQCGKTTLLDVVSLLVPRPLGASDITPAALFRSIALVRPCILLDEADTYLKPGTSYSEDVDALKRLINAGHKATGRVIRVVGENHEPRAFDVFSPMVLAAIGNVTATILNRAITVRLRRRLASDPITPLRLDRADDLVTLARKIARWVEDRRSLLTGADPQMPKGMINRGADNWRPLLTVSGQLGEAWNDRAHKVAAVLSRTSAQTDGGSVRTQLLTDLQQFFRDNAATFRVASALLVAHLAGLEDRPWPEFGRNGKPITTAQLAQLLRPFGITPGLVWIGSGSVRGYERSVFDDAFARYLA